MTPQQHLAIKIAEQASAEIKKLNNGESMYESACHDFIELFGTELLKLNGYEEATRNDDKPFTITSVCREDLQQIGFDTETLTNEDMQNIAERLGDIYLNGNGHFWNDLDSIAKDVYRLKQNDK